MIVGVVGKSGSGKTTMAKALEHLGFTRISLDEVARAVDTVVHPKIQEIWPQFFHEGVLDRKALGAYVFDPNNRNALDILNSLYQGPMWDHLRDLLLDGTGEDGFNSLHYVVEGYSLPIGLNEEELFWVISDEEDSIRRLMTREGHQDRTMIKNRLATQKWHPEGRSTLIANLDYTLEEFQERCRYEAKILLRGDGHYTYKGREVPCRVLHTTEEGRSFIRFMECIGSIKEGWVDTKEITPC